MNSIGDGGARRGRQYTVRTSRGVTIQYHGDTIRITIHDNDTIRIAIRVKLFLKQVSYGNIFLYSRKFINTIRRSNS